MFQLSAINDKQKINLSIFIEKTELKGGKEECREFYWSKAKNSPLAKENLKEYELGNLAIVEHDTKEYNGQVVNVHSLNAYLAENGYWMDIHFSKAGFTKKDKKTFKKLKKILPKYIHTFPVEKKEISNAILANKNNLNKIVKIVHLEVRKKMKKFLKKYKSKKIVILDIQLL